MSRYRKTAVHRPGRTPTYLRRRRPDEPRIRELRRLPWWADPLIMRTIAFRQEVNTGLKCTDAREIIGPDVDDDGGTS